ncbi:unnamed protein product [Rhizophagus irregularis]|nr:unnamed protein product [Rhizophagus irregularis]
MVFKKKPLMIPNILEYLKNNFTNWTSGNEKIDNFIQEMQLKIINNENDIVFEWIPYKQFNKIKKTGKNDPITVYSSIWKDGPLCKKNMWSEYYTRDSNKNAALKYLHSSQNSVDFLINEAKKYSTKIFDRVICDIYGISQNPKTNNYILVLAWASGHEKINNFIQEMQLKINNKNDVVFEWIPYNQFNKIKAIDKNNSITVHSAIWKNGPIYWNKQNKKYMRDSNKKVALKYLPDSHNYVDFLINEAKKYSTKNFNRVICNICGISQNPKTNNYILVLTWASGMLEWIPYNQFIKIKETDKNVLITLYSAIWKDGPLYYQKDEYKRNSIKTVALKCLHNSHESIDTLINEAKKYPTEHKAFQALYGISQNPNTEDYILVQNKSINLANCISGNEKIDNFIQERQLKINDYNDIMLEWIPYNQFNEIKETGKNSLITVYSAIWKDGPLHFNKYSNYKRNSNKEVALKCLHNSHDSIDTLINKAKKYPTEHEAFQALYGISQNPNTENYILVQTKFINLANCISGNEKIDNFIQERQLKINDYNDIVFEWIPYHQFGDIEAVGEGGFSTVYSAIWKDGPLEYDVDKKIYNRDPNKVIALKCLHNFQSITDKFLNEVKEYSINKRSNILNIYGISQNPDTKEYIIVLQYAKKGNFNHWINNNYEYFNWETKLFALISIINGLKEIHQRNSVHCDIHTGNILFLKFLNNFKNCVSVSDMGLCGEVGNIDKTKIYGVMPYVAPEVLRGKPYTQAADIYSFGMIMYFVATGRQPFGDRAHDHCLALDICKGIRPEFNESEAPRCYISLMKKCWNLDKNDRPNIFEVDELITSFHKSYGGNLFSIENKEIEMQFKEAEEYRKANLTSIENYQINTHPQAIYTSRLLNPFTEDLPKYDDDYNSQCLDQVI